jgi:hypothetical protein
MRPPLFPALLLATALLAAAPDARAVEGETAAESTVTVTVVPESRDGISYARRVEVRAPGMEALVRESDADGGRMLASVTEVYSLPHGRALLAGTATLSEGTRTLQVWLVATRGGRVVLLAELSFTAAHAAPLGGVVRTRGRYRVMIPAAQPVRAELEEWELTVHEAEVDRERMRFRALQHSRAGLRAGRRIAWIDVDPARDRFVSRTWNRR